MRGAAGEQTSREQTSGISTHAPHARRGPIDPEGRWKYIISTHAPHARRGATITFDDVKMAISTHAPHARRGLAIYWDDQAFTSDFYSRASCEARLNQNRSVAGKSGFLLTRLMRGAARLYTGCSPMFAISTHAPHARRGPSRTTKRKQIFHFYSRASCEARHW